MNETVIAALIQVIVPLVVPIILAWLGWLARKYVNAIGDEKQLAAIIRVANTAIDYAEDLDKRGDLERILSELNVPSDIRGHSSRGIKKLYVAGKWAKNELKRMGIKMNDEEAQRWVAAEFQRRIAGVSLIPENLEKIHGLLLSLQKLDQNQLQVLLGDDGKTGLHHKESLPQVDRPSANTEPVPGQPIITLEPSLTGLKSKPESPPETNLAELARRAVEHVETLKINRQLTVPEIDIATAWMLTEVTKQDLNVTPDQIAREIHSAFDAIIVGHHTP